jgi:hypothetical protein
MREAPPLNLREKIRIVPRFAAHHKKIEEAPAFRDHARAGSQGLSGDTKSWGTRRRQTYTERSRSFRLELILDAAAYRLVAMDITSAACRPDGPPER